MLRRVAPLVLCLITFAACGGAEPAPSPSASASVAPTASTQAATSTAVTSGAPATPNGAPSLVIRAPADDQTVKGPSVQMTLAIRNFSIVNKIGAKSSPGEGHIHYYLDVDEIPTAPGKEAVAEGEGRYVATTATSYTWSDLAAGRHMLGAQLINNDHTPLEPPVTAQVSITVDA